LDLSEPIGGWPAFLEAEGIDVQEDDCGRPAIARSVFGAMVRAQTSRAKLLADQQALRIAESARPAPQVRVPALEGRTAYESMMEAEGRIITPDMEFGFGRERPRFLEEQLDASARALAERRADRRAAKDRS
jgi:hypothetical protein